MKNFELILLLLREVALVAVWILACFLWSVTLGISMGFGYLSDGAEAVRNWAEKQIKN